MFVRTLAIASFAAVALLPAAPANATRLRLAPQWDDYGDALRAAAADLPAASATLLAAADLTGRPALTPDFDLQDFITINGKVQKKVQPATYPQELKDAISALSLSFIDLTVAVLDDFQEEIETFEAANPEKAPLTGQRKALDKARDIVEEARGIAPASRANKLRKALAKVAKVKVFPYVAKPPKNCGKPLQKGEFAHGAWAVYDFKSMLVEPYWFQANSGTALVSRGPGGEPTSLRVLINYCNGLNTGNINLILETNTPGVGTFQQGNNVGGFRVGQGFVINLTTSSTFTVETFDLEAGIVAGTFVFGALNGAGSGSGAFAFRIAE